MTMSRAKREQWIAGVLVVGGLLLFLALVLWARAALPCSAWNVLPAKDVPGRCLTVQTR